MKLLSFAIPCYNSAEYMEKCIKSCLAGGDDVEVIIVDDGSTKDNTLEIARKYEEKYPDIVKAVHQENGGHGQAVNTGLANATGVFFKVVDSDDWVDVKSYKKILAKLKEFVEKDDLPDMVIANYVYEKVGAKRKKVIHYENALPVDKMFGWDDMGHFKVDQYILMHSVIYRTQLIKDCGLKLPEHTFYVDNIFVFEPLPSVKKMYYINTNFYRYFIGRDDQSVNERVMISRIDQQLRVTKRLIDSYLSNKPENEKCRKYMRTYLRIMMEVSSIFLIISGTEENLNKKKELWKYVKDTDKQLYKELRYSLLGSTVNIPGRVGRGISKTGYKVMEAAIAAYGRADILVNNAGIIKRQDAIEFTEENWDSVIQVNEKMVFFLSQAFAKQLIKQGEGGKIINVCSMLSYQGGIRVPSYTASKSAVIGLTRAMANEWAKYNINVNGIAPGYMATNNTAQLRDDADRSEAILDRIPAGRWGTPEDMEGAVVYLASKASDYVNGFTLAVDGGWLAR